MFKVRPSEVPGEEGQIDEIVVGEGWTVHIEQMDDTGYLLMFEHDQEDERRFWLGSKSGRAAVKLVEAG